MHNPCSDTKYNITFLRPTKWDFIFYLDAYLHAKVFLHAVNISTFIGAALIAAAKALRILNREFLVAKKKFPRMKSQKGLEALTLFLVCSEFRK